MYNFFCYFYASRKTKQIPVFQLTVPRDRQRYIHTHANPENRFPLFLTQSQSSVSVSGAGFHRSALLHGLSSLHSDGVFNLHVAQFGAFHSIQDVDRHNFAHIQSYILTVILLTNARQFIMSMNKNSMGKDLSYIWNISNIINLIENNLNPIKQSE